MRCPRCNYPLAILEYEKIEIDYCLSCQGVWLDRGELELIVASVDEIPLAPDKGAREKPLRCPHCGKKMEKVQGGKDQRILLDRCKNGHGLWFDGGELEAILRHEKNGVDNRISEHLRGIFMKRPNRGETK